MLTARRDDRPGRVGRLIDEDRANSLGPPGWGCGERDRETSGDGDRSDRSARHASLQMRSYFLVPRERVGRVLSKSSRIDCEEFSDNEPAAGDFAGRAIGPSTRDYHAGFTEATAAGYIFPSGRMQGGNSFGRVKLVKTRSTDGLSHSMKYHQPTGRNRRSPGTMIHSRIPSWPVPLGLPAFKVRPSHPRGFPRHFPSLGDPRTAQA